MATIADQFKIDGENIVHALQEAGENLDSAQPEVVLDFSSVRRVDPNALRATEQLADISDQRDVKVRLHGVNVNVYKVLKLAKLTSRFAFTWDPQSPGTE